MHAVLLRWLLMLHDYTRTKTASVFQRPNLYLSWCSVLKFSKILWEKIHVCTFPHSQDETIVKIRQNSICFWNRQIKNTRYIRATRYDLCVEWMQSNWNRWIVLFKDPVPYIDSDLHNLKKKIIQNLMIIVKCQERPSQLSNLILKTWIKFESNPTKNSRIKRVYNRQTDWRRTRSEKP